MNEFVKERTRAQTEVYDVLGIGFGPANLALAVALEETAPDERPSHLFLEAKPSFVWHPGMLLEGSLLQVNVLKDLITVVNPCSRFTFLSYLQEEGRLFEFLNLRHLFPTRIEFNQYLTWAAAKLADRVLYGRQVLAIEPVGEGSEAVDLLRVRVRKGRSQEEEIYLTRSVVVATGGEPTAPPGVTLTPGGRAFHSHEFIQRLKDWPDKNGPYRFLVTGSGQSAAELFDYLLTHYPEAEVTATIRRFAYKPVDESDFTNRIFFPEWVDFYHDLPDDKRRAFFETLKDVNYAVIDHHLIRRINQTLYQQKVLGRERGRILPFLELKGLTEHADRVVVEYRDLMHDEPVVLEADALVLCTGYTWRKEHPLLTKLAAFFEQDSLGGYRVLRDYSIASLPGFQPKVYLQGYCEDTHGISETVLSLLPVRARDILRALVAERRQAVGVAP